MNHGFNTSFRPGLRTATEHVEIRFLGDRDATKVEDYPDHVYEKNEGSFQTQEEQHGPSLPPHRQRSQFSVWPRGFLDVTYFMENNFNSS